MSILARTSLPLRSQISRVRTVAPARFAHGNPHPLPFSFPGDKKASFAIKLATFLITGFSIPFAAAAWQLKKAGAA